jgi:hypothetical protein
MTGAILEEGGLVELKDEPKVTCQKGEALFQRGVRRGGACGGGSGVSSRGSCSSPSGDKPAIYCKDMKCFLSDCERSPGLNTYSVNGRRSFIEPSKIT